MNIRFEYLYRDAGNNKIYNNIIVTNRKYIKAEALEEKIRDILIDGEFFIAKKANIPKLQFRRYDEELDHDWYEFSSLEYTDCPDNDIFHRDVHGLLDSLELASII